MTKEDKPTRLHRITAHFARQNVKHAEFVRDFVGMASLSAPQKPPVRRVCISKTSAPQTIVIEIKEPRVTPKRYSAEHDKKTPRYQ